MQRTINMWYNMKSREGGRTTGEKQEQKKRSAKQPTENQSVSLDWIQSVRCERGWVPASQDDDMGLENKLKQIETIQQTWGWNKSKPRGSNLETLQIHQISQTNDSRES